MPDRGVPSPAIDRYGDSHHTPARARTHTTTQQWQSFEMRMRQRRAERCRLRAEVAIEAGFPDDAREALDEARRLQPELPGLISTEVRLAGAKLPQVPAAARRLPVRRGGLAAVVSLGLVAGFGGWLMSDEPSARPASAAEAEPAATSPVPESTSRTPEAVAAEPAEPSNLVAEAPGNIVREPAPPATPLVTAAPIIEEPPPTPPPSTPSTEGLALTRIPGDSGPPPPLAAPVPPLPPLATEGVRAPGVRVEPRAEPLTGGAQAAPSAEVNVRAALSRYEAAFSTLDASAARAVWPTVDANALGRAFDSLQAQQISLGNCSVLVTGQSARANCSGSATWTPKVGGGTRTEPRQWTFDLEQAGDLWEIVRATAR
jgi:hypothetical protein